MSKTEAIDTRATKKQPWILKTLKTRATSIFLLDVALFLFFNWQSGGLFTQELSIQSLLLTGTEALILALALAMMLGAGIFDLSLGANLVLSSVVGALVMRSISGNTNDGDTLQNVGFGITMGIFATLATGIVFGFVNGILVSYGRMNALIATLGTMGIGTGIAYVLSQGSDISGFSTDLQENFGLANFYAIPLPAILALFLSLILFLIVRYTKFGMRTLALGSSRTAAERVGIRVNRHLLLLATIAGGFAAISAVVNLAHFSGTGINGHNSDALNAVAAAVIGGTLLEGGRISVLGAIWGTALAVILQSGLVLIGVSSYFQLMAVGAVLILAVGIDGLSSRKRQRA
jgi:ribose transport system permease protein